MRYKKKKTLLAKEKGTTKKAPSIQRGGGYQGILGKGGKNGLATSGGPKKKRGSNKQKNHKTKKKK